MSLTKLNVQHYITQKLEANRNECQDAIAFNITKRAFAVADGASEAYGSRYWSRLIAKSWIKFLRDTEPAPFMELSACLGERAHRNWGERKLPWYAEEKLRSGSFAAFIGVNFSSLTDRISWNAISIGDCCLIQCRDGKILRAIPLSQPSEFTYRPILLPSIKSAQGAMVEHIQVYEGRADSGDVFFLMSDAVACWFLGATRAGSSLAAYFEELLASGSVEALDIFVDERRSASEMKDDDVAVIYIKVGS